jgi:uncharacterized membrane protein
MSAPRRVWIAAGIYALVYFVLGADRYLTYKSGADLGVFTQSIASVFHGFSNTLEGGSHFTVHFSPILYAFAAPLWLFHSALVLVAIQAIACALVGPPLYAIARRRLPENLAFGVVLVALLYPPLAGVTFTEFHEIGLAPATTLWLLWAVDARRWALAVAFAAVALGIKEDQGAILAFAGAFGVVYYLRARDRDGAIFSAALGVSAIAVFVFFFSVVRPLAGATDAWHPLHFYAWDRVVDSRGTTPWWSIGRPAYFLEALIPLAFACLFSPLFVLALPGFAECLLSHESLAYTMGQHYAAVWIPYVLGAFAFGIARIYAHRPHTAAILVRTAIGLCIAILLFASPTHWGHFLGPRTAHHAAVDRMLATLPPDAGVGTHDEIYAHLGFDPNASIGLSRDPHYALFDRTYRSAAWDNEVRPMLQRGIESGKYHLISSDDGVELYERSRR